MVRADLEPGGDVSRQKYEEVQRDSAVGVPYRGTSGGDF